MVGYVVLLACPNSRRALITALRIANTLPSRICLSSSQALRAGNRQARNASEPVHGWRVSFRLTSGMSSRFAWTKKWLSANEGTACLATRLRSLRRRCTTRYDAKEVMTFFRTSLIWFRSIAFMGALSVITVAPVVSRSTVTLALNRHVA